MILVIWLICFMSCTILAVETQNTVFLGVAILSIGLLLFYYRIKGKTAADPIVGYFIGIYTTIWGIATITISIINPTSIGWVLSEGFAGILLFASIYMGIITPLTCNKLITATYTGAQSVKQRYGVTYAPQFSYTYEDCPYESLPTETFSKRKLEKHYQEGETYPIYLNIRHPKVICIKRRPRWMMIWVLLIGIIVACIPFFAY